MPVGYPMKVVCYKKQEDGSEIEIGRFATLRDACKWANENSIMGTGWVRRTIEINDYPSLHFVNWRRYPNADKYRFVEDSSV